MRVVSRRETGGASSNQSFSVGSGPAAHGHGAPGHAAGPGRAPMRQVSDAAPTLTR